MSYTDLRDFTEEYKTTADNGLTVQVEKLGGGTLGAKYSGTWRYIVTDASGTEVARGQDFETGMPHSHKWVAQAVAEYFEVCDECGNAIPNQADGRLANRHHAESCSLFSDNVI